MAWDSISAGDIPAILEAFVERFQILPVASAASESLGDFPSGDEITEDDLLAMAKEIDGTMVSPPADDRELFAPEAPWGSWHQSHTGTAGD